MKKIGTSERYQNNNLKAIINYSKFLGPSIKLKQVKSKAQIILFLDSKIKNPELDPDKKWITTWNDYLGSIWEESSIFTDGCITTMKKDSMISNFQIGKLPTL